MATKTKKMTREEWLTKMIQLLRAHFIGAGFEIPPNVRVACGWPSRGGTATRKKVIGQCWVSEVSGDKTFEIFISPVTEDPIEVADILVHELIHATIGPKLGHKKEFRRAMKAVGLKGKPTVTKADEDLVKVLRVMTEKVGAYPHAKMTPGKEVKKDVCRLLKVACTECECIIRITQKWLDEVGEPTCGCGGEMKASV